MRDGSPRKRRPERSNQHYIATENSGERWLGAVRQFEACEVFTACQAASRETQQLSQT